MTPVQYRNNKWKFYAQCKFFLIIIRLYGDLCCHLVMQIEKASTNCVTRWVFFLQLVFVDVFSSFCRHKLQVKNQRKIISAIYRKRFTAHRRTEGYKGSGVRWNTIWRETVASHTCSRTDHSVFYDTRCSPLFHAKCCFISPHILCEDFVSSGSSQVLTGENAGLCGMFATWMQLKNRNCAHNRLEYNGSYRMSYVQVLIGKRNVFVLKFKQRKVLTPVFSIENIASTCHQAHREMLMRM